jgi:hypothetical protein
MKSAIKWLVWYDDNPTKSIGDKIGNAASRYRKKFGQVPNICQVHPADLPSGRSVRTMPIVARIAALRHHIWVGAVEDAK